MRASVASRSAPAVVASLLVVMASCGGDGDAPPRLEEHAAWGGQPPPAAIDGVRVGRVRDGIRIENGRDEPIFYAVWALGFLGQFTPCTEAGSGCGRLDRGAHAVVARDAMVGYAPDEREAVVRWWRVASDPSGGRRAHDLHVIGVRLDD